ncbi:MAG: PDC sensor domain-containing protein [Deltaproteobacteria bacterium]|nr:PDC sensor domain-containing protein [Deltaproteobacteria bacterium]
MKKTAWMAAICLFLVAGIRPAYAGEKAPQKVVDLATTSLAALGTDPVIVQAVKEENAKGKSLPQIQEMDKKWMATPGIADYMKALMESACGKRLREIQKGATYFAEIFVMDNQGANVAMTDKTSDYWQGDEAKFKESYKGGAGAVHISDVKFDDSSQAYLVQVSVPVKDGDAVIGAVTFGIDVDKL